MFRLALSLLCLAIAAQGARVSQLPVSVFYKYGNLKVPDMRIVGGSEVEPNSLPFQVSLQYPLFNFHFCGGSIFNSEYIITAAHCCAGQSAGDLRVNAGEHSLSSNDGTEQLRDVAEIIMHPNYNPFNINNDICLLKMKKPLEFNSGAGPIGLPSPMEEFSGTAEVSGWGTLYSGGPSPDKLMAVTVPIISDDDCRRKYDESSISDSMMCAGETGKDSCQGDSGGPLTCSGVLCGIVSWGISCAADYPGVYTQVSYFNDWIHANAGF